MLVETRLGRLFVEERGEGAPVLLWHSLLCEGGMWRLQVPRLAERHRVINLDAPGHGRSAPVRRAFSLWDCAEAAVEVMDALAIERAHWAGLSWGGMTGMRLALTHPDRLRSLALLDTSADREARRKVPSYRVMHVVAKAVGAVPPLIDRIEPLFFTAQTRRANRAVVEPFRDQLARMDPGSLGHAVDAVIFDRRDIRDRIGRIRLPTLVMVGREDVATPPARAREIADRIPGAELVELPGAAHLSALEQPDRVTEALLAHFERADG
ncbi:MAG TPA: alpha/beta fold hydrolase [Sandaracinaceae bacterium LLY-WYZ-13_1]|nr:alpha/beta fold hydrolase [Sandaracinaceae bacterium LLY-WYZ-13_1]